MFQHAMTQRGLAHAPVVRRGARAACRSPPHGLVPGGAEAYRSKRAIRGVRRTRRPPAFGGWAGAAGLAPGLAEVGLRHEQQRLDREEDLRVSARLSNRSRMDPRARLSIHSRAAPQKRLQRLASGSASGVARGGAWRRVERAGSHASPCHVPSSERQTCGLGGLRRHPRPLCTGRDGGAHPVCMGRVRSASGLYGAGGRCRRDTWARPSRLSRGSATAARAPSPS